MSEAYPAVPLWRERRFGTYWFGQSVSELGDRVSELALPLVAVTTLHAGPAEVGLLTAAIWTPNLASLMVGAWVDQHRGKRRLMVVANLVQALAVAALPVAFLGGWASMGLLYAVALVLGAGGVLFRTAYPTFFAHLVRRDQYLPANSLISATRSGSFVAGPPLAGLLVQLFTAPVAMLVDAVSFVVSAVAIGSVRVEEPAVPAASEHGLWPRAWEGLRYLLADRVLRVTLWSSTTLNLFSFVASAVLVLFASRSLGLDPGQIGLAFGIGAAGALAGAALAAPLSRRLGLGWVMVWGGVLFCGPLALVPLASGPDSVKIAVLAATEFVSGLGVIVYDVTVNSVKTAVTPDPMRSRVTGAYSTVNYGIRPLGALLGGLLGEWVGVPLTLVVAGAGGTLAALWFWHSPLLRVRRIEELDVPAGGVSDAGR